MIVPSTAGSYEANSSRMYPASTLTASDSSIANIKVFEGDNDGSPTDELSATVLGIQSCVDHLFALSILIRRQRSKGRLPPPNTSFFPVESSLDITNILDKFPKIRRETPWLSQRLGNAIGQRRHIIQYRQQHRQGLARTTSSLETRDNDAESTIATTFLGDADPTQMDLDLSQKRASVCTFATSFMSSGSQDLDIGHRIADLDSLVLDGVHLSYGEAFECPYCRTIQTMENLVMWR